MNKYKFYFIDNERIDLTLSLLDELNDNDVLEIELIDIAKFEDILNIISSATIDGLILDYRLDNIPAQNIFFKAPSVAQELRDRVSVSLQDNKPIPDFPIILCSTDDKIKSLKRDTTSLDLFDYRFDKEKYDKNEVIQKLYALAKGYKSIEEVILTSEIDISNIINRDVLQIDEKIFARFYGADKYPSHEIARHLLQYIINVTGCLIDENILAARLGINKGESTWEGILKIFKNAEYVGAFSDFDKRWWSDKVLIEFQELTGKKLISINAEERVNLLSKHIGNLKGCISNCPRQVVA